MKTYNQYIKENSEDATTIFMPIGIQGSGKSTWIKKNQDKLGDYSYINADAYREDLQSEKRKKDPKWNFVHTDSSSQRHVFDRVDKEIEKAIQGNKNIVLDLMNLTPKNRKPYIQKIKSLNKDKPVRFIAIYFPPNVEESVKRINSSRKQGDINFVPKDVVSGAASRIVSPSKEEGFDQIIKVSY